MDIGSGQGPGSVLGLMAKASSPAEAALLRGWFKRGVAQRRSSDEP